MPISPSSPAGDAQSLVIDADEQTEQKNTVKRPSSSPIELFMIRIASAGAGAPFAVTFAYPGQAWFMRASRGVPFLPPGTSSQPPHSILPIIRYVYAGVGPAALAGIGGKICFFGVSEGISAPYRGTEYQTHAFFVGIFACSLAEASARYVPTLSQVGAQLRKEHPAAALQVVKPLALRTLTKLLPAFGGFTLYSNLTTLSFAQMARSALSERIDTEHPMGRFTCVFAATIPAQFLIAPMNTVLIRSLSRPFMPQVSASESHSLWALTLREFKKMPLKNILARIVWKGGENGAALAIMLTITEYAQKWYLRLKEQIDDSAVPPSSQQGSHHVQTRDPVKVNTMTVQPPFVVQSKAPRMGGLLGFLRHALFSPPVLMPAHAPGQHLLPTPLRDPQVRRNAFP